MLPAQATPPSESTPGTQPNHRNAILINPIGPAVAYVAGKIIAKEEELDEFIRAGLLDINLRGLFLVDNRRGFHVQAELTTIDVIFKSTHLGLRAGPRYALRGRGLADWTVSPFALIGYTKTSAGGYPLSKWYSLGIGSEVGKTWVWKRLINDLNIGLYGVKNLGYVVQAESLQGSKAPTVLPIRPLFNWSIGYVF